MARKPVVSNIERGGAIHINSGSTETTMPLCGTYDRKTNSSKAPWRATRKHATCRRCMSMQRDIDAGLAAAGIEVPPQTRRRIGVPGQGANGRPRKKGLTSGYVIPEGVIDGELIGATVVEEIPAAIAAPALATAAAAKEQTEMTMTQQPVATGQDVVPATPADLRPTDSNSTSPLILDLGGFVQVDETKPTFKVTFGAPDQPSIVISGIEAEDKQTALVMAIKRLTFAVVQENTVAWMGGGGA